LSCDECCESGWLFDRAGYHGGLCVVRLGTVRGEGLRRYHGSSAGSAEALTGRESQLRLSIGVSSVVNDLYLRRSAASYLGRYGVGRAAGGNSVDGRLGRSGATGQVKWYPVVYIAS
jgi:hypothetical protein